ncbi:MAG TPA: hypothetical protein VGK19_16080 [Capsulimonadaceae bacterium]|jgi:hypothetical protein
METITQNALVQFAQSRFCDLAERIETGLPDDGATRALVVFNPTSANITGGALFPVDMPWDPALPFPPIVIRDTRRNIPILHELAGVQWSDLPTDDPMRLKGRHRLRFMMTLHVADIPGHGYVTFVASFTDDDGTAPILDLTRPKPELIVVETLLHAGDLPSSGCLVTTDSKSLVVKVEPASPLAVDSLKLTVTNNARTAALNSRLLFNAPVKKVVREQANSSPLPPIEKAAIQLLPRIAPGASERLIAIIA